MGSGLFCAWRLIYSLLLPFERALLPFHRGWDSQPLRAAQVLKVQYQTRDGTATAGEDYVTVQGEQVRQG